MGFHVLNGLDNVPAPVRGSIVAIGNFDGLHRGHQTVLATARKRAAELGAPSLLLTFEPHPGDVFAPEPFMFRLTDAHAKARITEALGLDGICIMPFNKDLAAVEAEDFVRRFLVDALGVAGVVVGEDFHFGHKRKGTPAFLRDAGERYGFEVLQLALLEDSDDPISSSRIRAALNTGLLDMANHMLGYHWIIEGQVIVGDQRGRELGYPTANFELPHCCKLEHGIYATRVRLGGRLFDGVASYGKPMFDIHKSPFEVHIFDFNEDIYGQTIEVALISHIRSQMTFNGLDELIVQMDADSAKARAILTNAKPISKLDEDLGFISRG